MARILLLIGLIVLLYLVIKRFSAYVRHQNTSADDGTHTEEKIVQCALCGTHVLISESMQLNEKTVCKQQPCQSQS